LSASKRPVPENQPMRRRLGMVEPPNVPFSSAMPPKSSYRNPPPPGLSQRRIFKKTKPGEWEAQNWRPMYRNLQSGLKYLKCQETLDESQGVGRNSFACLGRLD